MAISGERNFLNQNFMLTFVRNKFSRNVEGQKTKNQRIKKMIVGRRFLLKKYC